LTPPQTGSGGPAPTVPSVTVTELKELISGGAAVVDVRESFEWTSGHVGGAHHVPMGTVPVRVDELAPSAPVYVICESGARSWQVAAFLSRHGITAYNVDGGMSAWRANRFPMETGAPASDQNGAHR
jgi:rhodanese-related sulfurtransferase